MKYLSILLLALAVGCRTAPAAGDATTGGATPRAAIDAFMASMQSQDIQATAVVWGTERGPARDVLPDRSQLERRVLVMQCYLAHDRFTVLNEAGAGARARVFTISVTKGNLTRETTVRTVQGPASRWYVETVDLAPLQEICGGAR